MAEQCAKCSHLAALNKLLTNKWTQDYVFQISLWNVLCPSSYKLKEEVGKAFPTPLETTETGACASQVPPPKQRLPYSLPFLYTLHPYRKLGIPTGMVLTQRHNVSDMCVWHPKVLHWLVHVYYNVCCATLLADILTRSRWVSRCSSREKR